MLKKTYISEKKAIDILTKETGRKITAEHMKVFSHIGVVPAYMKFKPKDKNLYPSDSFHLVNEIDAANVELGKLAFLDALKQEEFRVLPFPLPKNGMVKTIEGIVYKGVRTEDIEGQSFRVYVAREVSEERFVLEEVSEDHYINVYAPNEVHQAKENVINYLDGAGYRPMKHSCCEEWDAGEIDVSTRGWFASPFSEEIDALNFKKRIRKEVSLSGDELPGKDMPCMRLIISAMRELIYKMDEKLEKKLHNDDKLIEELQKILPEKTYRGMSESSLKRSFSAASSARDFEQKRYE